MKILLILLIEGMVSDNWDPVELKSIFDPDEDHAGSFSIQK